MTRLTTELFRTPGIVFNERTGEEFDLTNILAVSKTGNVFVLPREHNGKSLDGRFIVGRPNKSNHIQIGINDDKGKKRYPYIHRLVAHAWLKREVYQTDVMHLDDNPLNNHISNLRWATCQDNIDDMIDKGRDNFFGKKKACSDEVMVKIYKMGKGGINMKPRHIHELFPTMSYETLYPMCNGTSKRLQRYLRNNLVK
jgi:hypothetical protein